jgi:Rrf2 family protein
MIISTKGRYALHIMTDLAQHANEGFVSLKSVAERQQMSMKYLESIVATLNKAGFVISQRGKDGGYTLSRRPCEYSVGEIVKLTEGSLAPVSCLDKCSSGCAQSANCLTLPVWKKLDRMIYDYLYGITLQDLIDQKLE